LAGHSFAYIARHSSARVLHPERSDELRRLRHLDRTLMTEKLRDPRTWAYGHLLREPGKTTPPLVRQLRRTAIAGIRQTLRQSESATAAAKALGLSYHALTRLVRAHSSELGDAYETCANTAFRPKTGPTQPLQTYDVDAIDRPKSRKSR
jgi:hypothetical protein